MKVSLIATVKNEADNIEALIVSMLQQRVPADEIVINDNGSTDDTVAIIERFVEAGHPIRLVHGGHNIPSGRNHAIRAARGPLIASCDAGLTLPGEWLATITAPLQRGEADVVGGFYVPAARTLWELALGAANYPDAEEVEPATFLPAGQSVAFTKEVWAAAGGYPEWADTCEDLVFDLSLKRQGRHFVFAPEAAVRFRPRETPAAFFRQYFSYARGDGQAGLWPRRHAIRYATYIGLAGLVALARRRDRRLLLVLLPFAGAYLRKPARRAWRRAASYGPRERALVVVLLPFIRLLGDVAKMAGYPAGVWRRLRPGLPGARQS